ncbi:hypothetical protein [Providencia rettgeri]|uniref:hypothetical protein n=1 Tax=Providencia rettgeri TaxID=587 RepID=UPI0034E0631F
MMQVDIVTDYLYKKGKNPIKTFFNQSEVFIGWKVTYPDFEVIYRLDNKELIICDFTSTSSCENKGTSAISFIKFIHDLEKSLTQIESVRGLFLNSPHPKLTNLRQRLINALISQGAEWNDIDNEKWLVYQFKR